MEWMMKERDGREIKDEILSHNFSLYFSLYLFVQNLSMW